MNTLEKASSPLFWGLPLLLFLLLTPSAAKGADDGAYLDKNWLIWNDLVDPSWDPEAIFKELGVDQLQDDDPRAEAVLNEFLERWNNAPVNAAMNGKAVKIPGFVVPLDYEDAEMREFFLVPFFGACIHVPPPPPNQIIYVVSGKGLKGIEAMEVVWVYGTIKAEKFQTDLGSAGYTLPADRVEIYRNDS
ncbi:MAG: DUF3299 domain-containing protein [Deltaproteobacteria bacterium]|jgi:hypothetical protein|nr:DUF3299 domain-containing protein [Deltaproteobacteria bacterium]